MKNKIKYFIFGFIISSLISGVIVSATLIYKASDIEYHNDKVEVTNVNDALNTIIDSGDATESDILTDKTALVNGKLVTGNRNLIPTYFDTIEVKVLGTSSGSKSITLHPGKYLVIFNAATSSTWAGYGNFNDNNKCKSLSQKSISLTGNSQYSFSNTIVYECNLDSDTTFTISYAGIDSSWNAHVRSMNLQIFKY